VNPTSVRLRPSRNTTELNLITQAKQGDRNAYGELIRIHRSGVINVVYRMCGDAELAEDTAQEAFIKAWKNLHRYQPRSAFKNWIYRIATNTALDVLRRQKDIYDIEDIPLKSAQPGPEAVVVTQERAKIVQTAVLALPPASRAVLILREYEDFSYREIAAALSIPIGTVMSRLNYARKQLRQSLAPLMEVT
jgi:RNA polymerase sigma-70 factor, ECF subfamily